MSEHDLIRRLRDAADLSEKGLPFVEGDDDLVADIEVDIALEREAADAIESLRNALGRIASEGHPDMAMNFKQAIAIARDALDA